MKLDHEYRNSTRRIRRVLWAMIGVVIFFWIGYEDRSTLIPILLGGLIAAALFLNLGSAMRTGRMPWLGERVRIVIAGLITGALAMPLSALLILIKISLHSHVPPDFTLEQVLAVLGRIPIWAGAGTLTGYSMALWIQNRQI